MFDQRESIEWVPTRTEPHAPKWMGRVLIAAGVYNLIWGLVVILLPNLLFDLTGMEPPRYPQIWQCVGMIVGVYGLGYLIAASNPIRHWPIVLVGFLGKILGPAGFAFGLATGQLPVGFGITILTNDLIWWVPFGLILWHALTYHTGGMAHQRSTVDAVPAEQAMRDAATSAGPSLDDLSRERPQLVVFLRHLGCTFCREALGDLRTRRRGIEEGGTGIVLVHMAPDEVAAEFLRQYDLGDLPRIADPEKRLYASFGLRRGSLTQLFGPRVWWRGFIATLGGHKVGKLVGDGFQMPGVFLVRDGRVDRAYRHETAGDRPDYLDLGACPAERPVATPGAPA